MDRRIGRCPSAAIVAVGANSRDASGARPLTPTPDGTLSVNSIGLVAAPLVSAVQEIAHRLDELTAAVAGFANSFTTRHVNGRALHERHVQQGDQLRAMLQQVGQEPPTGGSTQTSPPVSQDDQTAALSTEPALEASPRQRWMLRRRPLPQQTQRRHRPFRTDEAGSIAQPSYLNRP